MTKSKGLRRLENILVIIGMLASVGCLYIYMAYEYNFHYVRGTVTGFCDQGTRKGLIVAYSINGKSHTTCDQRHEDKGFVTGDEVYLRVLNGATSFAWIDLEKTLKESGVPPRKPADQ